MQTDTTPHRFRVFELDQKRYLPWRRFCRAVLLRGMAFHSIARIESQGMAQIPASGPTLLMMNHIGGIDPVVLMGAVGPRFLGSMSKIENFDVPVLGIMMRLWGAYPILRGEVDRRALDFTLKLLHDGELVLIAPEGTRQSELSEAKDGLAYLAVKANATIVPVGMEGTREFLDNLKHLRRTHITLNFGRPFRFRTDGRDRVPRPQLAQMTREAMYQLATLVRPERRGFYHDLSAATTDLLEFIPTDQPK
jgi:1-acyl-sn-glycerol-3-phosphate acyltransferase